MDSLLSVIAFICIVIAYIYKHITTKDFDNSLIFWSITLVMFANFSLTTWSLNQHSILEKLMFTVIFCGPLSVVYRISKSGNLKEIFLKEKKELKLLFPKFIYYLLYTVLSIGLCLLIIFSILNIFIIQDSLLIAQIVNRITIFLDWCIFFLLLSHIITTKNNGEKQIFWFLCFIAGIIFLTVQYNIHGDTFYSIPAIEPTFNSIFCSFSALIAIWISKIKHNK